MNGMHENDQTVPGELPEPSKPVAFCQHCGKALDVETRRVVGTAVYCEPCLAARLSGSTAYPGSAAPGGYVPVNGGGIPMPAGEPNPGLAALLGLIPGVGAMYNGQYTKGIVHLVIFAVLVSFSHVTGIFILFVFGWLAYMSIEAHHTAKARRDGTPLPNPFGFNDIGERMGFGKAWPGTPDVAGAARDAAQAAAAGFGSVHTSFAPGSVPGAGPAGATAAPVRDPAVADASWGAAVGAYPPMPGPGVPLGGTAYPAPVYGQAFAQGYSPAHPYQYGTQAAYGAPFVPPAGPLPSPVPVVAPNRFPAGAIWLIGLGTFFLLGTTGIFRHVSAGIFVGALLIGLAVWLFLRLMTDTGLGLGDDGTPGYRLRLLRALRPSVWLMLFGVLSLLNDLHWLRWEYSWPWLIILAGVMMLLNRAAYNSAAMAAMYAPAAVAAPEPPGAAAVASPEHTDPENPERGH